MVSACTYLAQYLSYLVPSVKIWIEEEMMLIQHTSTEIEAIASA